MAKDKSKLLGSISICFFFMFTVLLYGPLSLYLPNADDFWFSLQDLLLMIVPFSLLAFVSMTIVLMLLPDAVSSFAGKLIAGVTLGLYVQGNYININYGNGVLDGSEIPWNDYIVYGVIDTIVWVICIALPFIVDAILKKKEKDSWKYIAIACAFLTIIQVPALIAQSISYEPNNNSEISITDKNMFNLSADENVVIFILDTMDGVYYKDFLKREPGYEDDLDGFTRYDNTLASGARTPVAVPSMFTGVPFKKVESYSEYKEKVWSGDNSLSLLDSAGYDVGFYSEAILFDPACSKFLSNFTDGGAHVGSHKIFLKKIYKLDLYKFLPHFLKKYVWMDTAEFDKAIGKSEGDPYVINDFTFFKKARDKGIAKDNKDKAVRIYHLRGAHNPYRMAEDGTKSDNADLETQVTGVMRGVSDVLRDMKDKGVYDNTTIIITADHGDVHKCEWTLLLIKPKNSHGKCTVSRAPVSLFDLPILLANIADKKIDGQKYGMDIDSLRDDTSRERYFYCHAGSKLDSEINEYKTNGDASDQKALKLVRTFEGSDEIEPYELGSTLSFGVEASGNMYATEGFAHNTGMRTALKGPHSMMEIPIKKVPSSGDLLVQIDFNVPSGADDNIPMYAEANGKEVFRGIMTRKLSRENLKFKVPVSVIGKDKMLKLSFNFTDLAEDEMKEEVFDRTDTVRFISMVIDKE